MRMQHPLLTLPCMTSRFPPTGKRAEEAGQAGARPVVKAADGRRRERRQRADAGRVMRQAAAAAWQARLHRQMVRQQDASGLPLTQNTMPGLRSVSPACHDMIKCRALPQESRHRRRQRARLQSLRMNRSAQTSDPETLRA